MQETQESHSFIQIKAESPLEHMPMGFSLSTFCLKGSSMMQTTISHMYMFWVSQAPGPPSEAQVPKTPKTFQGNFSPTSSCETVHQFQSFLGIPNLVTSLSQFILWEIQSDILSIAETRNQKVGRHFWNLTAQFRCRMRGVMWISPSCRSVNIYSCLQCKYEHLQYSDCLIAPAISSTHLIV